MESEYWKSEVTIKDVTYRLAGFNGKVKAVYRIDNSDMYRCYAYDEVMGAMIEHESVSWEQAQEFMR